MNYTQILHTAANESLSALQHLAEKGHKSYNEFNFETEFLKDYLTKDIRESIEHKETFGRLMQIKGPVLYWFEILPGYDQRKIVERLNQYKGDQSGRHTPAIRKNVDYSSNVLYVGKVKNLFYGRVIQHLGFFRTPETQGLQLYHWMKGEPLQLRLHALEFEAGMANLLGVVENEFAKLLKPIIGKHK